MTPKARAVRALVALAIGIGIGLLIWLSLGRSPLAGVWAASATIVAGYVLWRDDG